MWLMGLRTLYHGVVLGRWRTIHARKGAGKREDALCLLDASLCAVKQKIMSGSSIEMADNELW